MVFQHINLLDIFIRDRLTDIISLSGLHISIRPSQREVNPWSFLSSSIHCKEPSNLYMSLQGIPFPWRIATAAVSDFYPGSPIQNPGSDFFHPGSRIDEDPGSASKNLSIFTQKTASKFSKTRSWLWIFISPSRIPDPWVKKAPDHGSATQPKTYLAFFTILLPLYITNNQSTNDPQ
jgi:hypothetical protein